MKKLNKLLFALVLLLLPFMVLAEPARKVVEADESVKAEGAYDSSRFMFGNNVSNNSRIDGIGFLAGNSINSRGTVTYGVYAGNVITISDEIEKDLFAAGNEITITEDAVVPRDAYIAGNSVTIYTEIGRDLYVGAETVDLRGVTVKGDVYISASKIKLDENTSIAGTFTYEEDSKVDGLKEAQIDETKVVKVDKVEFKKEEKKSKIISTLMSVATAFITMLVIFLLFPKFRKVIEKTEDDLGTVALTSLGGIALTICIPVIAIIAMLTVVLIPVSLMVLAGYFATLYLASLVTYYLIGHILYSKISDKSLWVLELFIGIVLFKLLSLIPYVGGLIGFLCFVYGMGKIYSLLKNSLCKK